MAGTSTVALLGSSLLMAAPAAAAPSAPADNQATAMPSTLAVAGHGYGHGRGMGQYGAFGYATGRSGGPWDHATILQHFYGGTTSGHINDNPLMAVLIKARYGQPMTVYRETGLQITGVQGNPQAVRITVRPDGKLDVQTGTNCLDFPNPPVALLASPARVDVVPDTGTKVLRLCNSDGSAVAYEGALVAFAKIARNLGQEVVNVVTMDHYMKGVVPRESPASWGDAEGGLGMASLRAQAVAARSYAAAGDSRWGDLHSAFGARATTCDDQYCQVYGGLADISPGGGVTYRTDPRTDEAVDDTAGVVRMNGSQIARTEFSSSTGGWTAGGTFPSVADAGDAVSSNPNHAWNTSVTRSAIESAYALGTLTGIEVLDRNDLGDMGGRVVMIRLTGTSKTVDVSGNALRSKLALKSDWFNITAPPPPAVQARSIDTACPSGSPSGSFTDVPSDSAHARAIDCVAWRQIAEGTGDGKFSPAATVTRAQMATFVARTIVAAGGSLPSSPEDAFDDDLGSVHEHAINQLAAVSVVNGVGPRTYGPQQPIDRAQVASILARALAQLGVPLASSPTDYFTDDETSVHEKAINQLATEGVVTGTSGRLYTPNASTRRDQMATMVARALDLALST
ncbi:MAG: S-layer homology domain-containing protein [Acidimicrobiales bacterium]